MNDIEKINRISKVYLKNIALRDHFKPVTQRNNVFLRLKRNTAVLNIKMDEFNKSRVSKSSQPSVNQQSQQKTVLNITPNKYSRKSSHQQLKHNNFQILQNLPRITQSKKSIRYNNNAELQLSKNEIAGTKVGSLSTRQILKKYQLKKLREQVNKKQFLQNHIKNIKVDQYEVSDSEMDQEEKQEKIKKSNQMKIIQNSSRTTIGSNKFNKLDDPSGVLSENNSHQKLLFLLQNRITDRDYIDFNVKLFQKRDINKKKFFQRYHNILKKQRQ